MNRREFLRAAGVISAGCAMPGATELFASTTNDAQWRKFVVTTRVEVLKPFGTTRIWLPTALIRETPYQKTIANKWECVGGKAYLRQNADDALGVVSAEFAEGAKPVLTLTSEVMTRDHAVDPWKRQHGVKLSHDERKHYLRPTKLLPTDGIVHDVAKEITRGAKSDVDKAQYLYEWVVDNTFRNPKTRGCGIGNIRAMLETRDLGGKCADLNALYVGLARAAGLPARDVYGVRVAKSRLGYKSLGPATENVTKAQHCRAEVFLSDIGWVPVDPADVRKVVLEEPPGNLPISDEMVKRARGRLFGSWEMNWMAFNFAHDVELPGAQHGQSVGFLMYPQAETAERRVDSLDAESFRYEITAREIV